MIQKAKEIVKSGGLGQVLTLHGQFWLMKPDDYFEVAWRREKGAGPVFLNLIHDVDLFRYLCGEVFAVQAQESNIVRGNAVEETAVILLRFANCALATVNVSDSVVAPWSWESTTGENSAYPRQDQFCYQIGGTHGALTIPYLELWSHPGKLCWFEPLLRERAIRPGRPACRTGPAFLCGDPWHGASVSVGARRAEYAQSHRGGQTIDGGGRNGNDRLNAKSLANLRVGTPEKGLRQWVIQLTSRSGSAFSGPPISRAPSPAALRHRGR